MQLQPRLIATHVPAEPLGVVLVLHGGAARRANMMVSPTQLSVIRMIPIAARIAGRARGRLAVFRLLNSRRGWDAHHTPVADVQWALEQVAERFGHGLPIALVGHSLGGRAALLAAGDGPVRSAVALNPWVYPDDGASLDLTGRRILIVHGTRDRIANPANSEAVGRTLSRTAQVGYIRVDGGKHAMLSHHSQFDGLAAEFAVASLLDEKPDGPVGRVLDSTTAWVELDV